MREGSCPFRASRTVYLGAAAAGWPGPKEKCRARRPGKLNREASRLGDVGPNAKWELRRKGPSPSGGRSELVPGLEEPQGPEETRWMMLRRNIRCLENRGLRSEEHTSELQ